MSVLNESIIKIIQQHTDCDFKLDTSWKELGLSSFDMFSLISDLNEIDIEIDYEKLSQVRNVSNFIDACKKNERIS